MLGHRCRFVALLSLLSLLSLLALACTGAPDVRDDAWTHRIRVRTDVAYGPEARHAVDLYLQGRQTGEPRWFRGTRSPRPVVVWFHGGGWVHGDKAEDVPNLLPYLRRGWNAVAVNYRLGEGTAPAAAEDAIAALRWVFESAEGLGFDREAVVVAGESAGGHLALVAGMSEPEVAAVVNWYGVTDLEGYHRGRRADPPEADVVRTWVGDPARLAELAPRCSPVALAHAGAPPILTLHGDRDRVVPHEQAQTLHARLRALGVVEELHTLRGGNHGGFSDAQVDEAYRTVFRFLEDRAGVPAVDGRSAR